MRILKFLISWQFWLSILLMLGLLYGAYYYFFQQWLYQHTKHGKEVHVPNIANLNIEQAIYKLDSIGLSYEIDSIKFDSARKPNTVLSFYPAFGSSVKEGRTVFIKSNPKTWLPVELPNLIDKSNRLAYTQLSITGLAVGDTLYEPDIAKNVVLKVLYQGKQIAPGTKLPRFSKVDLVLGRGLQKDIKVPSFIGLELEKARYLIEQNYFEVGLIEYYGTVADSTKAKVFFQEPLQGDILDQGLPINLWVTDSLYTDINEKITALEKEYKNIFEEDDSTAIEEFIKRTEKQTLRGLDENTRRQLEENPNERKITRPKQTPKTSSKPKQTNNNTNSDELILPEIE